MASSFKGSQWGYRHQLKGSRWGKFPGKAVSKKVLSLYEVSLLKHIGSLRKKGNFEPFTRPKVFQFFKEMGFPPADAARRSMKFERDHSDAMGCFGESVCFAKKLEQAKQKVLPSAQRAARQNPSEEGYGAVIMKEPDQKSQLKRKYKMKAKGQSVDTTKSFWDEMDKAKTDIQRNQQMRNYLSAREQAFKFVSGVLKKIDPSDYSKKDILFDSAVKSPEYKDLRGEDQRNVLEVISDAKSVHSAQPSHTNKFFSDGLDLIKKELKKYS